jgi:YD repeat-containing protein
MEYKEDREVWKDTQVLEYAYDKQGRLSAVERQGEAAVRMLHDATGNLVRVWQEAPGGEKGEASPGETTGESVQQGAGNPQVLENHTAPPAFCVSCGAPWVQDAKFCFHCGNQ